MSFSQYQLTDASLRAIEELGYLAPTEIQSLALPKLLGEDRDFIGQAQTGTGKTLAFVLPLLEKLSAKDKFIQALVLTPTRELAQQVCQEVEKLGKYSPLKALAVYGGAPYDKQIQGIRRDKPQIIVGTPGRVIDLMERGVLDFSSTNYIVLDEADEMLNMGFFDDVQLILSKAEQRKAFWMFSATMPKPILRLIAEHFDSPEIVHVEKRTLSNSDIEQLYYLIPSKNWEEAICRLIDTNLDMYGIVFCNTKQETWELTESLLTKGYLVEGLHGDMGQVQRERAMSRFKSGRTRLLICTDVAARGIDVNNLTHVINYGLPRDTESYVHRIGRTGRAGMKGIAIALVDPRQTAMLRRTESFTRQRMVKGEFPSVENLKVAIITRELEASANMVDAVKTKGEGFNIDPLFQQFADYYKDLDREQILKLMFSMRFNKTFRKLNELSTFDRPDPRKENRERSYNDGPRKERPNRNAKFQRPEGGRRTDRNDRPARNSSGDKNRSRPFADGKKPGFSKGPKKGQTKNK